MNYIQIPDFVFERMLKTLQQGVDVCYNVDYSSELTEHSPSYATGYSRATMQEVIEVLNQYKRAES